MLVRGLLTVVGTSSGPTSGPGWGGAPRRRLVEGHTFYQPEQSRSLDPHPAWGEFWAPSGGLVMAVRQRAGPGPTTRYRARSLAPMRCRDGTRLGAFGNHPKTNCGGLRGVLGMAAVHAWTGGTPCHESTSIAQYRKGGRNQALWGCRLRPGPLPSAPRGAPPPFPLRGGGAVWSGPSPFRSYCPWGGSGHAGRCP